jgi:hypothetical protein
MCTTEIVSVTVWSVGWLCLWGILPMVLLPFIASFTVLIQSYFYVLSSYNFDILLRVHSTMNVNLISIWGTITTILGIYLSRNLDYFPFVVLYWISNLLNVHAMAVYDAWDKVARHSLLMKSVICCTPFLLLAIIVSFVYNWYGFEDFSFQFYFVRMNLIGLIVNAYQQIFVLCTLVAFNMVVRPKCCTTIQSRCEIVNMLEKHALEMKTFEKQIVHRRVSKIQAK